MTDDIVARLREGTSGSDIAKTDPYLNSLMQKSADEIERLRRRVDTLKFLADGADDANFLAAMHATTVEDLREQVADMRARLNKIYSLVIVRIPPTDILLSRIETLAKPAQEKTDE